MTVVRKPPVGAKPGTLEISTDAPPPRIRIAVYDESGIEWVDPSGVDELRRLKAGGRNLWVDIQGFGDERLLRDVAELFSLHPLALEDVVHVPIRPKAENYPDNLLITTRMLRDNDGERAETEQVSLIVGTSSVVSFQEKYDDDLDPVRRRLEVDGSRLRKLGPDYLAYAILDTIVDAYYPIVDRLSDEIDDLEEAVLRDPSPEILRQLNRIKSTLLELRRAVAPQRDAINALVRGDSKEIGETVQLYLRDTYDHIVQTVDAIEAARELVNSLLNLYMTALSNRMNEIMKTLTIVASIFVPLTFMAGIYGMNFENMPELHMPWTYPALLIAMSVVALGMVGYFWRKGWIGR